MTRAVLVHTRVKSILKGSGFTSESELCVLIRFLVCRGSVLNVFSTHTNMFARDLTHTHA